jgi:hypothetical protein
MTDEHGHKPPKSSTGDFEGTTKPRPTSSTEGTAQIAAFLCSKGFDLRLRPSEDQGSFQSLKNKPEHRESAAC